ncbi:response regulator receiver domain [Pedobacter sp.]|jgi:hypothetical protein|uniref:response regulator receiver domain n=1 Tax=Pedobacter sp. TaxID=1411316 RepID=UPI002B65FDE2|nr:response regulator receiver domain [Pedobacter sp.]HWW37840.1 response regulator receiver domain [Pedobacter sp.]
MIINALNFEEASNKIVSKFLHSVVVVDDRASLDLQTKDLKHTSDTSEPLVAPTRRQRSINITPVDTNSDENGVADKEGFIDSSDLDAKKLIDKFAEEGLVCAVLKPVHDEEGLNRKTDHATHKSDIVILDWQIGENEEIPGTIALALIKKIITTDSSDRLRLIAIYTSNPDLSDIVEKVKQTIKMNFETPKVDGFEISRGPIKVVIYQKYGGSGSIDPKRVVNEGELPARLIGDFTNLTKGLLSNVALRSLGILRENTHRILNKFTSNLDSAYIGHRILNNPPDEAENHPVPLLASELLDVLEGDSTIRDLISIDFVHKWLEYQISVGLNLDGKFEKLNHEETLDLVKVLLQDGVEKDSTFNTDKPSWNSKIKKLKGGKDADNFLTQLFSLPNATNIRERNMDFAILTTVRSKYELPAPLLTLGSIVVQDIDDSDRKYFLCIQPLCDSVRLVGNRKFSFIPLEKSIKPDKFHMVVKDRDVYVTLLTDLKPYNTVMLDFDPQDKGEIIATKDETGWIFKNSDESLKFRWIADLKFPHAQRIITQYSEQLGRVGLTESDWLRRMAR